MAGWRREKVAPAAAVAHHGFSSRSGYLPAPSRSGARNSRQVTHATLQKVVGRLPSVVHLESLQSHRPYLGRATSPVWSLKCVIC